MVSILDVQGMEMYQEGDGQHGDGHQGDNQAVVQQEGKRDGVSIGGDIVSDGENVTVGIDIIETLRCGVHGVDGSRAEVTTPVGGTPIMGWWRGVSSMG